MTNDFESLLRRAQDEIDKLSEKQNLESQLKSLMPVRFEKNIQAFSKYLPKIAEEFRHYKPQNLELFCTDSGHLNIIDPLTGKALYGQDPLQQCEEQVERLSKKPQFSTLDYNIPEKSLDTFIHTKYLRIMHNIYLEAKKTLEPLKTMPEHLGSAVIFGIGLGYHLEPLFNKTTIDHIYLCEPNRDMFFASLFTCDWEKVLEQVDKRDGVIMLNVGVSFETFTADFINEMKHRGSFNSVSTLLYQHYPSKEINEIIQELNKNFHILAIGWGFVDDGVISIAHDYHNAKAKLPTLKKDAKLPPKWRHMPVFIVANGPSLDLAIEEIKAHRDEVIIFSCGSAIMPLLKHNIIPDFHIALERTKFTFDYYNEFIDKEILEQIGFLTVNVMHPDCSKLFGWTGIGFKAAEPGTTISSEFIDRGKTYQQLLHCNPVVANTAASFACNMGFEEIYLMGVDGGYKDPQYHHSKSSTYFNDDGSEKKEIAKLVRAGELRVPGNFCDEVFTTAFFNVGNSQLGYLFKRFKNVNVYNCSDGVKLKNTIPLQIEDLLLANNLPNKEEFIDYIKNDVFIQRDFDPKEYEEWLAIDEFANICDGLIKFVDREFTSRADIATALKLQVRFLYSYGYTRYRHIFFLLDGTLTYVHSIFRMMLYQFEDEEQTVKMLNKTFKVFIEYMLEAKVLYTSVLDAQDEQRSYLMGMLDNDNKS
jgi:hypothetical protein